MRKKCFLYILTFVLLLTSWTAKPAQASTPIKGTFVGVGYEEVQVDKKTTEKRLKDITIRNDQGREMTLQIDTFAQLTVDSRPVKIEAFKLGMEIEADVNLRRVKALRGKTGTQAAVTESRDRIMTGLVSQLDPQGKFLSIRLDDGRSQTYFITNQTKFFKGSTQKDRSVIHEGDRVKLSLSTYNTNRADSIEVIDHGIQVEALYKGKIQRIDSTNHKLIVAEEQIFKNWLWWASTHKSNSSYTYSTKTPIYVGTEQIQPDRLRYYANQDIYYVTVKQAGKEVIQKMVIKNANERTFNESIASVNLNRKEIGLHQSGTFRYHDGTILIRNGRLVDPVSLQAAGTALIITEGGNKSAFANVIHIANDGLQSPNMTDYSIYYGRIDSVGAYQLTLSSGYELANSGWSPVASQTLSFSNDTVAVEDRYNSVSKLIPQMDLKFETSTYGYFIVQDGTIIAVHLIHPYANVANLVSIGRLETVSSGAISVINVSQWNGYWREAGKIYNMDIRQATILKDGKVIALEDLKANDRLYILHESSVKGRIIIVD
ncbi:translation initiation factor IF-1 [Sporosarcina luteola]|nr:translation initiation factor IF-1 [Sporosarcina luteola]